MEREPRQIANAAYSLKTASGLTRGQEHASMALAVETRPGKRRHSLGPPPNVRAHSFPALRTSIRAGYLPTGTESAGVPKPKSVRSV